MMNYFQKKKLAFMSIVNKVKGFVRTITGALPLTLEGCVDEESIIDYTLYGQSVQDGTPTPDTPVEVESVGEKTRNLFNPKQTPVDLAPYLGMVLENKTYTLRIVLKEGKTVPSGVYFGLMYSGSATWFIENGKVKTTKSSLDLSAFNNVSVSVYSDSGNTKAWNSIIDAFDIYLTEGTITTNEPYGYKIPITASSNGKTVTTNIYLDEPLRKVGEYADYVDLENGKVVRKIKKKQLTKAITLYTIGGVLGFHTDSGFLDSKYSRSKGLCNREKSFTETRVNDSGTTLWLGVNNTVVYWIGILTKLGFTTLAEMNTWLKENETCIYWATNKPTETSIELPPIPTFKGTSIISADTTIQPSNVEITYYSNVKE